MRSRRKLRHVGIVIYAVPVEAAGVMACYTANLMEVVVTVAKGGSDSSQS